MNLGVALATVSCVLLALVAGLLLLLGQLLRGMRRELREAPLLAEKLAQQLLAVRSGLDEARVTAHKLGPDLMNHLKTAQTVADDLKFLIARAEQLAGKLESATSVKGEVTVTKVVQTVVEQPVALEEGARDGDPLESLLADLEQAAGSQKVRRHPSQAELELRAKERN